MDITPPADDKGLRRLKLENEKSEVKQTSSVSPYPRIVSSKESHEHRPPMTVERRHSQRRVKERRQTDSDTAFDTRGHEERRKSKRRTADRVVIAKAETDESSEPQTPAGHIDEKV